RQSAHRAGQLTATWRCALSAPTRIPITTRICTYRRNHLEAVAAAFFDVLELARELKGPERHLRARGRTARASRGE
ncbi:MAG: hypothetical protein ABIZ56_02570, partial [Chthoniobacteraceae bacterium]